jgi:iron complex outermembrane recepter protein
VTIPNLSLITDQRQMVQQLGAYAQDQIRWGKLIATLSTRHDWVDAATDNRLRNTTLSQDDGAWSGRAGLMYLFDNGLAPYATWSTSFLPVIGTSSSGDPFAPSTAQQFEVGLRYQPPGMPIMLSAAAFDITQTNVATYASALLRYQNGEVRSRGIEFEARGEILPGWNVMGAYTYLDAEVTRATNAEQGNRPIGAPAHTASFWSDYTFQDGPLAGFGFGAGVRWIGSTIGGYMPNP